MSLVFLGCQKVLWKGLLGHIRFGAPSAEGSSIPSLNLSPSSSTLYCISPNAAIVKSLGQNDTFVFCFVLQQMAFAYQNVLWSVPQTVLYIALTVSCGFFANGSCFRKGSVEGSANYSLHLSPKWLLLHKNSLEGSANYSLHLSPKWLLLHKNSLEGSANYSLHLSPKWLLLHRNSLEG